MKATNHLKDDHKQILRGLNVLEQLGARAARGEPIDGQDVEDILRFLQRFVDSHHQGKEESILFPAMLRDGNQDEYPRLSQMVFEHNRERSLVEGLEDSLRTKKAADLAHFACRLVDILRTHIDKEDHVLFELVDSILSPQKDELIARELENFESTWRQNAFPELLKRLTELECKYARSEAAESPLRRTDS
jgi:hemerythrin-like domain-containing protein